MSWIRAYSDPTTTHRDTHHDFAAGKRMRLYLSPKGFFLGNFGCARNIRRNTKFLPEKSREPWLASNDLGLASVVRFHPQKLMTEVRVAHLSF